MIERVHVAKRLERLALVEQALSDPDVLKNRKLLQERVCEHAALKRLESAFRAYEACRRECASNREIEADGTTDADMRALARGEREHLERQLPGLERQMMVAMLPPDPTDIRNALFEVRAGTGGQEAALFAGDLFRMYSRYAESRGLKVVVMDASPGEMGGYKEILFMVAGEGAYGTFRYESGGHRVQRVPVTEAQGRIHTSAATVAVFPEVDEEDDVEIPADELRIDIFCAGGHGGQGVNTTYSAIRITHLPTGLVAQCQDERSQHRNKDKAMKVLKSRLLDQRRLAEEAQQGQTRRDLIGSGDRSQRIRTYNFPQNRMTDHRVGLTLYSLDRLMEGGLDELLDTLQQHAQGLRLEAELQPAGSARKTG